MLPAIILTPCCFLDDTTVNEKRKPAAIMVKTNKSLRGVKVQLLRLDARVDRGGVPICVGDTDEYFSDIEKNLLAGFSDTLTSQVLILPERSSMKFSSNSLFSSDI